MSKAKISVKTEYMEHEGGTKFYEVVLLEGGGQAMCIKRFGKLAHKKGGGQTVVERGSVEQMTRSFTTIVRQKQRRGYSHAVGLKEFGLHGLSDETVFGAAVFKTARGHYGANSEEASAIESFFDGSAATEAFSAPAEPEVEVDRGDAWGMF